ncbi:UNVERIFIED_ORG: hypothetical protein M2414_004234 [Rahnella aquatilis]
MQNNIPKSSLVTLAIAVLFTAVFNYTSFFEDLSAKDFTLSIVAFIVITQMLVVIRRKIKAATERRD